MEGHLAKNSTLLGRRSCTDRPMRADDAPPQTKMGIASTSFTPEDPAVLQRPAQQGRVRAAGNTYEFLGSAMGLAQEDSNSAQWRSVKRSAPAPSSSACGFEGMAGYTAKRRHGASGAHPHGRETAGARPSD